MEYRSTRRPNDVRSNDPLTIWRDCWSRALQSARSLLVGWWIVVHGRPRVRWIQYRLISRWDQSELMPIALHAHSSQAEKALLCCSLSSTNGSSKDLIRTRWLKAGQFRDAAQPCWNSTPQRLVADDLEVAGWVYLPACGVADPDPLGANAGVEDGLTALCRMDQAKERRQSTNGAMVISIRNPYTAEGRLA